MSQAGWLVPPPRLLPARVPEGWPVLTSPAGGLLPPVMSDPVLLFVLLVEAVMPSAQVRRGGPVLLMAGGCVECQAGWWGMVLALLGRRAPRPGSRKWVHGGMHERGPAPHASMLVPHALLPAKPNLLSTAPPPCPPLFPPQNLIILLQLSERTQGMAPGFARMLLKLYFYAILPVTLWVTSFATNLGVPVLR